VIGRDGSISAEPRPPHPECGCLLDLQARLAGLAA